MFKKSIGAALAVGITTVVFGADAPANKAVTPPQAVFNFDHDPLGKIPSRFIAIVAGRGPDIRWEVRQDPHAPSPPNILMQSGKASPGENFALLLVDQLQMDHGEMVVRFRPMAGDENQSAGIVCRYKDPQNYYVIQADSQGDACRLVRFKKGKKKIIDSKDVVITTLTWHELRISFNKTNYTASVDNELVLGAKDAGLEGPGQVGLWTASDSAIEFDDLRISE